VVCGLGITIYALRGEAGAFNDALVRASVSGLFAGFILTLLASVLGYESFRRAFDGATAGTLAPTRLASLYFSSQLLRHLPGRYLGVVYQIARTRSEVPVGTWVAVNVVHSVAIASTGVLVGLIVILAPDALWAIAGLATAAGLLRWIVSTSQLPLVVAAALMRSRWRPMRAIGIPLKTMIERNQSTLWACVAWAGASWLVYLVAWAFYGWAFPDLGAWQGTRLSAYYALAWFVGFASVVAPSGWGVREATFLAVARNFSGSVVAYGLVIGRVSLLLNDLILGGVAVLIARYRSDIITRSIR
jgi:hypothetical protein